VARKLQETEVLWNVWDKWEVAAVNWTTNEFETKVVAPQKPWFPTTSPAEN